MNLRSLLVAFTGALALATASAQNPNPAQAADTEIVAFEPQPDGLDVFFTGDPNQVYAIYTSSNGRDWEYHTMSASLDGDIFHFYDEEAPNHKARFYRIAVLNQPCQLVGQELERYLLNCIDYLSSLSRGEQDQLKNAVQQYITAINGTKQAKAGLKQAQAALADYLRLVSAARLAWLEAQKKTGDAKQAKSDTASRPCRRRDRVAWSLSPTCRSHQVVPVALR